MNGPEALVYFDLSALVVGAGVLAISCSYCREIDLL
jgi:hypothetical protein